MSKIIPKTHREANTLDAMRAHVLEGKRLPERLKHRFDQLDEIWKLIRQHGRANAVKFFAKRHGLNVTSCYTIVRQSMDLFGDVLTSNKDGERQIIADRLDKIWAKAMAAKDYSAANKAMETKMKLLKLDSDNDVAPIRELPSVIIFSSDPVVLKANVEDVPYESADSISQ